jgi:hypothetical protein
VTAIKGYPGLQERWDALAEAIDEARKAAVVVVAKPDEPPPPPPQPAGKIGVLGSVSNLGIYVKLDANILTQFSRGDQLEVFREGQKVGEIAVDGKGSPDASYPNGSLKCSRGPGSIQRGDEVRIKK